MMPNIQMIQLWKLAKFKMLDVNNTCGMDDIYAEHLKYCDERIVSLLDRVKHYILFQKLIDRGVSGYIIRLLVY